MSQSWVSVSRDPRTQNLMSANITDSAGFAKRLFVKFSSARAVHLGFDGNCHIRMQVERHNVLKLSNDSHPIAPQIYTAPDTSSAHTHQEAIILLTMVSEGGARV